MPPTHQRKPASAHRPASGEEPISRPAPDGTAETRPAAPPEDTQGALFRALRAAGTPDGGAYTAVMEVMSMAGRNVAARIEARLDVMSARLSARFEKGLAAFRNEVQSDMAQLEARLDARFEKRFQEHDARLTALEGAVRELTARVGTALERSWGTRRAVWGVLGSLALLIAGAMIRPVFERAVSSLFSG